jgi:sigma-E factor negative regulatory protein RseA
MTDQIREQMSALLDGELPSGEVGLLVRRMERDAELRRAFGVYVLAGESLRSPGGVTASPGFAARVAADIDDGAIGMRTDDPVAAPRTPLRWRRPLAAAAVAAGAALAAVLLVRPDADPGVPYAANAAQEAGAAFPALPVGGASPTPAQNQRLSGYLVVHGQYASPIGRRNVWSSALAADPGINRVGYENPEKP